MRLILKSLKPFPQLWCHSCKIGSKKIGPELVHYVSTMIETPPRWVQTSKLWKNGFINEQFTLKYLLLLIFIFINIGTWNTSLNLFDPFWDWWRRHGESKLKKNHFSITTSTWNTILGSFWPNFGLIKSPESKLQHFEKAISETNSSLQSPINY